MPLTAGLIAETDVVVEDHLTADRMGNPGFKVLSTPALVRRVSFALEAHDEKELIGKGTHERVLVDPAKFLARVEVKAQ